ncbi:hypothetical protein [Alicyclobacillus dauci]|uniref:Uncharacterized protein n=1 Tax=Alicyclobacillus dauci TaxID=1475485 RepID=A0ABY6Z1L3_9BACL|nr:hypothetical protein [Alicyclobacillus dauci]WAH36788.1 hypothetical protein NZD86_21870 [Alicyclobacillus dauci]
MKHFLDKMFRPAVNDNQRRVVFPPLPNHFTKNDAQQRALIGWIARRVGQLLTLEAEETDLLFYTAFSYQPNKSRENDVDHILYFADHLVRWDVRDNSAS